MFKVGHIAVDGSSALQFPSLFSCLRCVLLPASSTALDYPLSSHSLWVIIVPLGLGLCLDGGAHPHYRLCTMLNPNQCM